MTNPEVFSPEIFFSLLIVGVVAVVCTGDWFKKFWTDHICGPPECFDCNETDDVCYKDKRCKLINK